jgi:large subunit ribosomal protein L17
MNHQNSKKKLNCSSKHRKALVRNQAIHFFKNGILKTTIARIKEVRKVVEKVVTIAKHGKDFNKIRKVMKILPYDKTIIDKIFLEIAPKYTDRPGGYTRIYLFHRRISDTANVGQLAWVEEKLKLNEPSISDEIVVKKTTKKTKVKEETKSL